MPQVLAIGPTPETLQEIFPDPASLTWGLQDISAADAGRVQDAGNTMYKMRTSQKRKLQVSWTMLDNHQAATILQLVNSEYFWVRYWDVMNERYEIREMYVGDRTAPFKWFNIMGGTRYSTLSFDLIER